MAHGYSTARTRRLGFERLESREMLSLQSALQTDLSQMLSAVSNQPGKPPYVLAPALDAYSLSSVGTLLPNTPIEASPAPQFEVDAPFRMGIFGDGFFVLRGPRHELLYTRDTGFRFNDRQQLVTSEGVRLLGYGVDDYGQIDPSRLVPLRVPFGQTAAKATRNAFFSGNLSPESPIGSNTKTEFVIYDDSGSPLTISLVASMSSQTGNSTAYRWSATLKTSETTEGNAGNLLGTGEIWFDRSGNLIAGGQSSIVIENHQTEGDRMVVALHFDQVWGLAQTDFNGDPVSSLRMQRQNGAPTGTLINYAITEHGLIQSVFSNGLVSVLGQIQLATFADTYGLVPRSVGRYSATSAAEPRTLGNPGQGQMGQIVHIGPGSEIDFGGGAFAAHYPWELRTRHLEIQGDGFFVVADARGRKLFTRDGRFHLNAQQELATDNGLRLLGYGVDDEFALDPSALTLLQVPLGSMAASATKYVHFNGVLNPRVNYGDTPGIMESQLLWDAAGVNDGSFPLDEAFIATLPLASSSTRLVDIVRLYAGRFDHPFAEGTLRFIGVRGGRNLAAKELEIDQATTLGEFTRFMDQALGVDHTAPATSSGPAGGTVVDGLIRFVSNPGIENELDVLLSAFILLPAGEDWAVFVGLSFQPAQEANGEGATTVFEVFDAAGDAISVTLTTVIETKLGGAVTYRWFAFSADNQPSSTGVSTALGSGIIAFDAAGKMIAGETARLAIEQDSAAIKSPLVVELDFREVSSLPVADVTGQPYSNVYVFPQDGFPPGTLENFMVSESGLITGVFDNGMTRTLGQIQLATFRNPRGLAQVVGGMYAATIRSGRPQFGAPGNEPLGELTPTTFPATEPRPPIPRPRWSRSRLPSFLDRFDSMQLTVDHSKSSPQSKLLDLSEVMRWTEISQAKPPSPNRLRAPSSPAA